MRLLARNVRQGGGEIDLVLEDGHTLVFVEVKARRKSAGRAAEAVTLAKQGRIASAASVWLARNGVPAGGCRFDVVTVAGTGPDLAVEHIPGAFDAPARPGI
jgi:putative endonuclease